MWIIFYDGWMDAILGGFRIHCHYISWKSQQILQYNTNCIHLKEESHTHTELFEGE